MSVLIAVLALGWVGWVVRSGMRRRRAEMLAGERMESRYGGRWR